MNRKASSGDLGSASTPGDGYRDRFFRLQKISAEDQIGGPAAAIPQTRASARR
jgi:hypothetical protein